MVPAATTIAAVAEPMRRALELPRILLPAAGGASKRCSARAFILRQSGLSFNLNTTLIEAAQDGR
jgi:hypothetical protein